MSQKEYQSISLTPPTFTDKQIALYEKRFKEGFDLHDPQYELWVKENHPGSSDADSMKTHISKSVSTVSSGDLSEILKYPEAKVTSKAKKPAINSSNAVCLSDSPAVRQLKEKEEQKRHSAEEKVRKKEERERKKEEREWKKLLKEKEKKEKRQEREIKRRQKEEGDDCPVCHVSGLSCQWICCDNCNVWYHTHCTDANPDSLPDMFYCLKCV